MKKTVFLIVVALSSVSLAQLSSTLPGAPTGGANVIWQPDPTNHRGSGYIGAATISAPGVVTAPNCYSLGTNYFPQSLNSDATWNCVQVSLEGTQGPAGLSATIAIGNVLTGAAGTSATVTNSGSSSAAVLNFTLPEGATGATGPTGPTGATGSQGAPGPAIAGVSSDGNNGLTVTGNVAANALQTTSALPTLIGVRFAKIASGGGANCPASAVLLSTASTAAASDYTSLGLVDQVMLCDMATRTETTTGGGSIMRWAAWNNSTSSWTIGTWDADTVVGVAPSANALTLLSETFSAMLGSIGAQAASANLTTYAGIAPSANAQTLLGDTFAQMLAAIGADASGAAAAAQTTAEAYAANSSNQSSGTLNVLRLPPVQSIVSSGAIGAAITAAAAGVVCTTTCTVTPPTPALGLLYCVRNAPGSATVITLAALGSGNYYELTTHAGWGTANHTLVSGGVATDNICLWGYDANHYMVQSYTGTWTD